MQKPGATSAVRRELSYFVGSGAIARSYLTAVDGFLYEALQLTTAASSNGLQPGYDRLQLSVSEACYCAGMNPTQSSAPMNLGAYQIEQGHDEEAIRLFKEALILKISRALLLVRLNLAVGLNRTGQPAQARAVLEKALEFNPSFTAARELLAKIR